MWEKLKPKTVKYAVSIYGILQDTAQDGKKAALTFGPATGSMYTQISKSSCGSQYCIHDMSWQEIITQANKDPNVFQTCLTNGCTKTVELALSEKLLADDYEWPDIPGDGCSVLYESINESYRKWNNIDYDTGGWPASRIRATLNGKDGQTNPSVAGNNCLDAADALISAFPDELKNGGIVAKAVRSDTVYDDLTSNNVMTYDKLWLFSGAEIYQDAGTNNNVIRPHEGIDGAKTPYDRAVELEISTDSSLGNGYGGNKGYKEDGSAGLWWLRSLYRSYSSSVCEVGGYGDWSYYGADYAYYGAAPGFCLGKVQ